MILNQNSLRHHLELMYDIRCFQDLNALGTATSGIYRVLQQHHQCVFDAHQRLTFFSKDPVSRNTVQHIVNGCQLFDIDLGFVLVCCPNNVITDMFDPVISVNWLQCTVIDACDSAGEFANFDTLCPMPWLSMQITNQGKQRPCCVYNGHIGDIANNRIQDTFVSSSYQDIRKQMTRGSIPDGCSECFQSELRGDLSNRQRSLTTFAKEFFLDAIDHPKIMNLDIRGGITCNMKCRICNDKNSSQWAAENQQLAVEIIEKSDWSRQEHLWQQILELLPQCVNIDFYGGEPLLSKQIIQLIETVIDQNLASEMRLNFNTNGSVWNQRLMSLFDNFRLVNVGISIDDIGARFELQRGSSWQTVCDNTERFISYQKENFYCYIYTTVNIQNVCYLPELLDWAESMGIKVMLSCLSYPWFLSVHAMTDSAKNHVIKILQQHHDQRLHDLVAGIKTSAGSDGKDFIKYMQNLDQKRREKFSHHHLEIALAMGYTV